MYGMGWDGKEWHGMVGGNVVVCGIGAGKKHTAERSFAIGVNRHRRGASLHRLQAQGHGLALGFDSCPSP